MDYFQNKCYILYKFQKKHFFLPRKRFFGACLSEGLAMSAEKMPQLLAVGESHKGCVRAHNEDNFFCISMYPGYCFAGRESYFVEYRMFGCRVIYCSRYHAEL